jgi:hypothetical protein
VAGSQGPDLWVSMLHRAQYQAILGMLAIVLCIDPVRADTVRPYDAEPPMIYTEAQLEFVGGKVGITDEIKIVKNGNGSSPLAILHAEHVINKKIVAAYLDCSAVSAELIQEEGDVRDRRLKLEAQRNTRILVTNSANFLSTGAIFAPGLGYSINPQHLPTNGNIIATVGNGTSTLLSVLSLAEQRSGHSKDSSGASILAPLFFDDVPRDKFTPYVWDFLVSVPIDLLQNTSETHIKRLVSNWIKAGLAPDPKTSSGRRELRKLLELDEGSGLNISELRKRETMLAGLRTTVLQMTKGLEQLNHWM